MVDIIIVTYNGKSTLRLCIDSIMRHTASIPYKMSIVDNNSSDGTAEWLIKNSKGRFDVVLNKKNSGFSGGANIALRRTKNPWVVLMDDDVEVTKDWLRDLLNCAKRKPDVGIVSGRIVFPDHRIWCAEFKFCPFGMMGAEEKDRGQRSYTKSTDALVGPCWLIRRKVIEKVGDLDESYYPSQFEDIDYCIRARLAGFKVVYHGPVKIVHHHLYRFGTKSNLIKNTLRFFDRWGVSLQDLCITSDGESRLLKEGADHLNLQKFSPYVPNLGWLAQMNANYSTALYKGIAWCVRGDRARAVEELRRASTINQKFAKRKWESAKVSYILSVYFSRLGYHLEAKKEARRVLNGFSDHKDIFLGDGRGLLKKENEKEILCKIR